MLDQIIFSRWPMQAAPTARARMADPKYCKVKDEISYSWIVT